MTTRRPRLPWWRRILTILLVTLAALLGLALALGLTLVLLVRGSLPTLDGQVTLDGLDGPVAVTRDSLGVPDLWTTSRLDAARALGYVHGQDRFFQMDLQRRGAAGELAALLGPRLLPTDRDVSRHRFRHRAEAMVADLPPDDRALLQAYADGANAGLHDLGARPPEYLLLRQKPEPWRPADTILTLHAMCLDLSLSAALNEPVYSLVHDTLPPALATMLTPWANVWDGPLDDAPVPGIEIPTAADVDVRDWTFAGKSYHAFHDEQLAPAATDTAGSNNWAQAGHLTAHGGAILAGDMHLAHALPNIWYRARMSWPEGDGRRAVVGVTLPGTPVLVAGSNGDLAWAFTNSAGDWAELVILEQDPADSTRYLTPDGWRTMTAAPEILTVAGAPAETLVVRETIWGPVWSRDHQGRPLALRWTAHDAEAVNLDLRHLESVTDVDAAVALAGQLGIPPENLVCADRHGRVAWALAGRIPRRVGWDGRTSVSWADGAHRWDGYLDPAEQPRLVDPPDGVVWTANNRVTAGADLALIGDGGYALGARARQIRDRLWGMEGATERDHLALQLDDRALMLSRWRGLFLHTLAGAAQVADSARQAFTRIARDDWTGHADPGSVAYRLVRHATFNCIDDLYRLLLGRCRALDPDLRASLLPHRHAVTWAVLKARPPHLLPPWHRDWDDLILTAVDDAMAYAARTEGGLADHTWDAARPVTVAHPFAALSSRLERLLVAPTPPLPGDSFMPRVQHRRSGASQRLVVSPGREEEGLFHMPGGQSGHPWSPYFLAGHDAWVEGRATPLLPGPPVHHLTLMPPD